MFSNLILGSQCKMQFSIADCRLLKNVYLLLTKYKGHTVNYGTRVFSIDLCPSAKRVGHKSLGKMEIRNLQYTSRKQG